jgi:hypothetical protein
VGGDGVTKNRERLLEGDVAVGFLLAVMGDPAVERLLSSEHFSVDGALIDVWASMKSFWRKDGADEPPTGPGRNAERNFHGERRSNDTHVSTTDPDARLYRKSKGQPARLCYRGHLLIENRHSLIVDTRTTHAPFGSDYNEIVKRTAQGGAGALRNCPAIQSMTTRRRGDSCRVWEYST